MPLDSVLHLLRAHQPPAAETAELAVAAEIIRFVEAHSDCLLRSCLTGHLTGSAWIVDPRRRRALLVHHRKLDKWLQPGGHADGDPDLLAVARREANEETGLHGLRLLSEALFDLDSHRIPARGEVPEHWHHDLRFLFQADPTEPLVLSDESHDLAWIELEQIEKLNSEESIRRMVRKTRKVN